MFIKSLKYDYQTAGILVEYVTKSEARQMSNKLIKAIFEKGGELNKFEGFIGGVYTVENYLLVGTDLGADQLDQIIEFIKSATDPDQYDENDYEQKGANESYSDEPSPFETYEAYVASDMEDILNERGITGSGHNKYLDTLDKDLKIRKELRRFFEEDVDEEEAAERLINLMNQEDLNEDFSMGVSGPTGLNQGIPHGGPGKGCLPKPLYNPKAKAVPAKEKDDKDTEENLKKLRSAKKLLKNEGFSLVKENAAPLMDPIDQFENYLHDKCGFEWDEVDSLVDTNQEMIEEKLKLGMSFANISASLDDSCLR